MISCTNLLFSWKKYVPYLQQCACYGVLIISNGPNIMTITKWFTAPWIPALPSNRKQDALNYNIVSFINCHSRSEVSSFQCSFIFLIITVRCGKQHSLLVLQKWTNCESWDVLLHITDVLQWCFEWPPVSWDMSCDCNCLFESNHSLLPYTTHKSHHVPKLIIADMLKAKCMAQRIRSHSK